MRIVVWGTYDLGKPRGRILLRGLRENGVEVHECLADVWGGIEDKSQLKGVKARVGRLIKWLLAYPSLIYRYMLAGNHDVVLVGYPGMLDVLVLWPFAKLRRKPIVWDAFLSLYNTVVEDRQLISPSNPLAWLLYGIEWLACRAANLVILDTRVHADYFVEQYNIARDKTDAVFVGAESDVFPPAPALSLSEGGNLNAEITVLFYGQFIPLHGIETIVLAARQMADVPVRCVLVGQGQEEDKIRLLLYEHPLERVEWIPWVPYKELINWIAKSDVCLGIFGDTEKAGRVIPNKVFQILSSGKPLITMDSAAIRELIHPEMPGVSLVPPGDSKALANAIRHVGWQKKTLANAVLYEDIRGKISPKAIGNALITVINTSKHVNA